jgi:hypothetical protein
MTILDMISYVSRCPLPAARNSPEVSPKIE